MGHRFAARVMASRGDESLTWRSPFRRVLADARGDKASRFFWSSDASRSARVCPTQESRVGDRLPCFILKTSGLREAVSTFNSAV